MGACEGYPSTTSSPVPTDKNIAATALIGGEAVQQTVTAGAAQVGLAATAIIAARRVRRIPRPGCIVVSQSDPVGMPEHGRALRAARPVAAGTVLVARISGTVRLRAGQDVVPVRRIAAAIVHLAFLRERGLLGEVVGA